MSGRIMHQTARCSRNWTNQQYQPLSSTITQRTLRTLQRTIMTTSAAHPRVRLLTCAPACHQTTQTSISNSICTRTPVTHTALRPYTLQRQPHMKSLVPTRSFSASAQPDDPSTATVASSSLANPVPDLHDLAQITIPTQSIGAMDRFQPTTQSDLDRLQQLLDVLKHDPSTPTFLTHDLGLLIDIERARSKMSLREVYLMVIQYDYQHYFEQRDTNEIGEFIAGFESPMEIQLKVSYVYLFTLLQRYVRLLPHLLHHRSDFSLDGWSDVSRFWQIRVHELQSLTSILWIISRGFLKTRFQQPIITDLDWRIRAAKVWTHLLLGEFSLAAKTISSTSKLYPLLGIKKGTTKSVPISYYDTVEPNSMRHLPIHYLMTWFHAEYYHRQGLYAKAIPFWLDAIELYLKDPALELPLPDLPAQVVDRTSFDKVFPLAIQLAWCYLQTKQFNQLLETSQSYLELVRIRQTQLPHERTRSMEELVASIPISKRALPLKELEDEFIIKQRQLDDYQQQFETFIQTATATTAAATSEQITHATPTE